MATMKDSVAKDTWEVIKDNYEKGSYTTAVTNLIQYINEICRERTGLSLDNTKLMEKTFLGDKPNLLINKFETQTEKDIQAGIGYILKGICLAIRNPRSHERFSDDQKTATTIILFLDYILNFIRNSKQMNLIEDWTDIIFDENFSDCPEYSNELFKNLPNNKKLDIIINAFRNCEKIQSPNAIVFIELIIDSLSEKEKEEYFELISKNLIKIKDNEKLYSFFNYFPPKYWKDISTIARLRIESMVVKSFRLGSYVTEYDNYGNIEDRELSKESKLAIASIKHLPYFELKEQAYKAISDILMSDDEERLSFLQDVEEIFVIDANDILNLADVVWAIDINITKDKKNKWIVDVVRKLVKWDKNKEWIKNFEKTFDDVFAIKKTIEPIDDSDLPF